MSYRDARNDNKKKIFYLLLENTYNILVFSKRREKFLNSPLLVFNAILSKRDVVFILYSNPVLRVLIADHSTPRI